MTPDVKKTLDEYFMTQPTNQPEIETLEFSHKGFTKRYLFSYQAEYGQVNIKAKLETGESVEFEYRPITVTQTSSDISLDQSFDFGFGDMNKTAMDELTRAREYNERNKLTPSHPDYFPKIVYRLYNYLYLDEPLKVIDLEFKRGAFKKDDSDGMVFAGTAAAPTVNNNRTGETYNLTDVPMLQGFIY